MDNENRLLTELSKISPKDKAEFQSSIESNSNIRSNFHRVEYDLTWLDVMEETVRYIDNILINPKRFIINEEEIVKVEKSKKVTVESVIHLSQHTNLISDYNEESGEVKPSKVLNILKEETLDMYENRFIYSLILNMQNFIARYGYQAVEGNKVSSSKIVSYEGSAKKGDEDIKISLNIDAVSNTDLTKKRDGLGPAQRLEMLKQHVTDFTGSELYKDLARMHCPMVRSPIRKTNVILKNPNFQKAEALWNYMERFDKDNKKEVKYSRNFSDNKDLQADLDLSFLIDYSIIDKLSKTQKEESDWESIISDMLKRSIKNYLDYDPTVDETKFLRVIKKEFNTVKSEQKIRFNAIRKIINNELKEFAKKRSSAINIIAVK